MKKVVVLCAACGIGKSTMVTQTCPLSYHSQMMLKEAPENFNILHYVSYAELKVKK